ncbi:TPA: Lrp/AsnC family transcriptional regulator, partial [Candidatus Geothermarchaeota archaeon]|nr:Lrp/AsnC family transcriptional regulator [Candidatus Geothermarchaeota archaeon]
MKLKISTLPKLDFKDIKIIEGLSKYTPRNILKISREIGIPESTIRYRISTLIKRGLLRLYTNVYHTNIGLKKHVVFTKYNPIYKDDIYNLINAYS